MIGRPERATLVYEPTFLRTFWWDCWPNLTGLLGANLLFLLWCAPALLASALQLHGVAIAAALVTVGPGLLGLFTYASNLVLERRAGVWRDGTAAFRRGFGAGVVVATVALVALTAQRLALERAVAAGMTVGAVALWAGQVGILVLLLLTGAHTLSLIAMYRQGVAEAFRNAVLLTLAHPVPTVGVAGAGVLVILTARLLSWGPLVILPALLTVLAVRTTHSLIAQHSHGEQR